MKIEKKLRKDYFEKLLAGEQNSDMKLADFECNEGDVIVYKEWNAETKEYTGRTLEKTVVDVVKSPRPRTWTNEDIDKYGFMTIYLK